MNRNKRTVKSGEANMSENKKVLKLDEIKNKCDALEKEAKSFLVRSASAVTLSNDWESYVNDVFFRSIDTKSMNSTDACFYALSEGETIGIFRLAILAQRYAKTLEWVCHVMKTPENQRNQNKLQVFLDGELMFAHGFYEFACERWQDLKQGYMLAYGDCINSSKAKYRKLADQYFSEQVKHANK